MYYIMFYVKNLILMIPVAYILLKLMLYECIIMVILNIGVEDKK